MKTLILLFLIGVCTSLLCILENVWIANGLALPGRIDLYNQEGIVLHEDLDLIGRDNPDWDIIAVWETTGILECEGDQTVSVMAVSPDYVNANPIHMVRGVFDLNKAVLIRSETACQFFNSDDVVGEEILFNGEGHVISGVFAVPPLIKDLDMPSPDILISWDNTTIKKTKGINRLQVQSASKIDVNDLYEYLDVDKQKNLHINRRFLLVKQSRDFLYLLLGSLILFVLVRIVKRDFSRRKQLYKEKIQTMYRARCLKILLCEDPFLYCIPIALMIGLAAMVRFHPYLPPETLRDLTAKKILYSPIKFMLDRTISIDPAIVLPQILETISFSLFAFLFLPLFYLYKRKQIGLKDGLFLPFISIISTLFFLFEGIQPVFDYKINLLLMLFIIVSAAEKQDPLL